MRKVSKKFGIWGMFLFMLFFAFGVATYTNAAKYRLLVKDLLQSVVRLTTLRMMVPNRRAGWSLMEKNTTSTPRPAFS